MTITNQKPTQPKDSAVDPFKRAITGCMRAIAAKPDLEVTFAADRPTLTANRARLPEPPRKMTPGDVAVTRGLGDSIALRLACHDAGVHRARQPEGKNARAVFDAVEQARVEALGAMRMSGVGENIAAMLEDRYHRGNYHEVTDRADAPLEDAVALMVREKLTGKPPPKSARKVVDLWRDWIAERAGDDFARLSDSVEDQVAFADVVRDMIASLDMGDELGSEGGE
ncbi:MAG: cobaltochelatase subunit CobT, partial [Rhizobiales bacterium]|nr:cobaltochelatase subunit CobT [Hyphomicrobiales bacterium]